MEKHRIPIFDGHNDLLLRLFEYHQDDITIFFKRSTDGHMDLPRMQAGNFGAGFFAVFVPSPPDVPEPELVIRNGAYEVPLPPPLETQYAYVTAMAMVADLFRLEAASEGKFRVARTVADVRASLDAGVTAAILHFEGVEAIDPQLYALEVFYQAGLRSLGPVWSRPNAFGHGVPFCFPSSPDTGPGLTEAGRDLVRACNRLGILIDLSHLNERGFWDVADLSTAPLVATHSCAHALCPSSRNLTDKQLHAIRDSDGVVGVNFAVSFLRSDGDNNPDTPLDVVVQHIEYLVERLGVDRVGFGSDFDGATIPREIGDVAGVPRILDLLRQRGYDEPTLRKIAYENWLRVLGKTWHD